MTANKPEQKDLRRVTDIDRVIHEPSRLLILGHLSVVEEADFLYLENLTGMTRGNLSSHLSKLEDAGYVYITKEFVGKMPRTVIELSEKGRTALGDYLADMKLIIDGFAT